MAQLLLENNSDPNIQNLIFGRTALHYAAEMEYSDILNLLIEHNADASIVDKTNKKPQDMTENKEIQSMLANISNMSSSKKTQSRNKELQEVE